MASSRIRVCYVLPLFDPATEQHFYYLHDLLRRLAKRVDLEVIVEKAVGAVAIEGARVRVQRQTWPPARALEMLCLMVSAVLRGHRQIYTHYSTYGGLAAVLCRFFLGAKAHYWNCEENAGHFREWRGLLDRDALLDALFVRGPTALVIKLSDVLVTGTPLMARYYSRVYGIGARRIAIMPNWVDLQRFHPIRDDADRSEARATRERLQIAADVPVALFVHRLSPRKGSRDLPGLIRRLAVTAPRLHWVIAGDGPDRAWLDTEVAPEVAAGRVRILGNVQNREIAPLYRAAEVLVMPSRQEGFPRVLLEAMASGLAYAATAVGGVRDLAGDLAGKRAVVERGDLAALAERVQNLVSCAESRHELAEEGLRLAAGYTPDRVLDRLCEILGAGSPAPDATTKA